MAEEILTALARCAGLFVIARNSSFVYKGRTVDIRQVGRELGVRYVLEGSVRRGGNRLRVTSQLIDAASGAHIWADRFEGDLSDVFDLQDRITGTVVGSIEPNMQLAEIERLKHKTPADLNAYDHLLRAYQLEHVFTRESLDSALRHLRHAADIDPTYAPAMAFAAYCHGWRLSQAWANDVTTETAQGLGLMSRALELGKFDASVLWMCAFAAWQFGLDDKPVLEFAYRSLEMNANSAIALTVDGRVEVLSGHFAMGEEMLTRAQRLSPRDPRAWFTFQGMALACLGKGNFEEGASWARKAIAQNPRFTNAIRILAVHLAHLGQIEAAPEFGWHS
jgi:tetratricopeptide (TPR) repeat protein